jgi:alpha-glucosidase
MTGSLLALPHHDGSDLHVETQSPALGDRVAVFVHAPVESGVRDAAVRFVVDGEPRYAPGVLDRTDDLGGSWWRFSVQIENPVTPYRFLLDTNSGSVWLDGRGTHRDDPTDARDFRLLAGDGPPTWTTGAVMYQVFPDRFARSDRGHSQPDWAVPAQWSDPPRADGVAAMTQWYGGDLDGVTDRLEHIAALGASVIYLCPFFPSSENHRYCATSFARVDEALGGDAALVRLTAAAHRRGIRVIGDLTLNHCGSAHEWFLGAQADPDGLDAAMFSFAEHPSRYRSWLDVPSLPSFDHRATITRDRLYDGSESVVRRFLRPPYELDGWRIDVANMVGRHGADDLAAEVSLRMRQAMSETRADSYLVAEHAHDASSDLCAGGWDGVMGYAAFTRPVWRWLGDPDCGVGYLGEPFGVRPCDGPTAVAAMDAFSTSMPWRSRMNSLNLLASHDTARFRTVTGSQQLALVGAALAYTLPGMPSVFMGDEWGVEGTGSDDGRRPMPWPGSGLARDDHVLATYCALGNARRHLPALAHGGLRWVSVGSDHLAFVRRSAGGAALVVARRNGCAARIDLTGVIGPAGRPTPVLAVGIGELEMDGSVAWIPEGEPGFAIWELP